MVGSKYSSQPNIHCIKLVAHGLDRNKIKIYSQLCIKRRIYTKTTVEKNAFRNQLGIPLDKFVIFGDGQVQAEKV